MPDSGYPNYVTVDANGIVAYQRPNAWQAIAPQPGFANAGGTYDPVAWRMDADWVYLRGVLVLTAAPFAPAPVVNFWVPPARLTAPLLGLGVDVVSLWGELDPSTGTLLVTAPFGTWGAIGDWLSLDGIRFRRT